jgi:hypothetical protein
VAASLASIAFLRYVCRSTLQRFPHQFFGFHRSAA